MTKDQKYDNNPKGKEAKDQQKDREVIQNLVDMFGRGEITLAEMWARIDHLIDVQYYPPFKPLIEPINVPTTEKV